MPCNIERQTRKYLRDRARYSGSIHIIAQLSDLTPTRVQLRDRQAVRCRHSSHSYWRPCQTGCKTPVLWKTSTSSSATTPQHNDARLRRVDIHPHTSTDNHQAGYRHTTDCILEAPSNTRLHLNHRCIIISQQHDTEACIGDVDMAPERYRPLVAIYTHYRHSSRGTCSVIEAITVRIRWRNKVTTLIRRVQKRTQLPFRNKKSCLVPSNWLAMLQVHKGQVW